MIVERLGSPANQVAAFASPTLVTSALNRARIAVFERALAQATRKIAILLFS